MTALAISLALLTGPLSPTLALGQSSANGSSIDIEMVRPSFGHRALAGLALPEVAGGTTVRVGTLAQWTRRPLTLRDRTSGEALAVVRDRVAITTGASVDVQRFTFGLVVPLAAHMGSETPEVAGDVVGLGDVGVSGGWTMLTTHNNRFALGGRVELLLPTGRKRAYIGEAVPRVLAIGQLAVNPPHVTVAHELGVMQRFPSADRTEIAPPDTEILWRHGIWAGPPRDVLPLSANVQLLGRAQPEDFLPLRLGWEGLLGVDVHPSDQLTLGAAVGRGLTDGIGTSDLRVLAHVVWALTSM